MAVFHQMHQSIAAWLLLIVAEVVSAGAELALAADGLAGTGTTAAVLVSVTVLVVSDFNEAAAVWLIDAETAVCIVAIAVRALVVECEDSTAPPEWNDLVVAEWEAVLGVLVSEDLAAREDDCILKTLEIMLSV